MGQGWFKNQQPNQQPAKQEKQELITDFNELIDVYNDTMSRVQILTNDAYQAIYPLIQELIGEQDNPQSLGEIGQLRAALKSSRLLRTDTGRTMWSALKNMEDLQAWQDRYSTQLESFVDAIRFVAESAFEMLNQMNKQIETYEVQMQQMQSIPQGYQQIQQQQPPIIPPNIPSKPAVAHSKDKSSENTSTSLTEERKRELEQMYNSCVTLFQFGSLVNSKRSSLNFIEMGYLREYNKKKRKFKGKLGHNYPGKQKNVEPNNQQNQSNVQNQPQGNGVNSEES